MKIHGPVMLLIGALALSGCSKDRSKDAAEAADGWSIAPGVYGNVRYDREKGSFDGFEVELEQGSAGREASFVRCTKTCGAAATTSIRRGLNGVSFAVEVDGKMVDVTIQPGGPEGVELSADWGAGVTSIFLPKITHKLGLSVASAQ